MLQFWAKICNIPKSCWIWQTSFGRAFANAHIPPTAPTLRAGSRKFADPAKTKKSPPSRVAPITSDILAMSPELSFIPIMFGCFDRPTIVLASISTLKFQVKLEKPGTKPRFKKKIKDKNKEMKLQSSFCVKPHDLKFIVEFASLRNS